jgi:hypothetical protein
MARPTYFELHIRPLIRELDREQMLIQRPGLDLWNADIVKSNATRIVSLLENSDPGSIMPPMGYGGPWPAEWIGLFKQWISEGFPRLELGSASQYQAARFPEIVVVTATVTKPNPNYAVWLDRYVGPPVTGGLPDLVLFQAQRDIPPPLITDEGVGIFRLLSTVTSVRILDKTGLQTIPITAGTPEALQQRVHARK